MIRLPHILCCVLLLGLCGCGKRAPKTGDGRPAGNLLTEGKRVEEQNYGKADSMYHRALELAKGEGDEAGMFRAYRYLLFNNGILQSNFDSGLYWGQAALASAESYPRFRTAAYSGLAMLYQAHEKPDSAAVYYQKGITLGEAEGDTGELAPMYANISGLYNMMENYPLAREYQQKYIRYVAADTGALIGAYSNMYISCIGMKDSVAASRYLYGAYRMLHAYPHNSAAQQVYSNLAELLFQRGQYDSTRFFGELRLQAAHALNDTLGMIKAYLSLEEAARAVRNPDARRHLDTLQQLSALFPPPPAVAREVARAAYQLHVAAGDTIRAFTSLSRLNALDSAINSTKHLEDLESFEQAREAAKAEQKILRQQIQVKERGSVIVLLIAALLLLFVLGAGLVWRSRKKRDIAEKRLQFMAAEAEWSRAKASLEAQLEERNRISRELHDDLGASLTSIALAGNIIRSKAPQGIAPEVAIISDTASGMVQTLNEIVWMLNSRNDSLLGLLAYIRKFAAGFLEKAGIAFSMDDLADGKKDIPVVSAIRRSLYLACKEAIHNAVKHSGATNLLLSAALDADLLKIIIRDNGRGLDSTQGSTGNGLQNMERALTAMGGTCTIQSNKGTTVTLTCRLTPSAARSVN